MRLLSTVLTTIQIVLASRVLARLIRTANGVQIREAPAMPVACGRISVLVPVLDEEARLEPCLAGLTAQGDEVAEILVIDGGSADGTRDVVRRFAERDLRVRLIEADAAPDGVNGKAWQLQSGLECSSPASCWILTIDADVRPAPPLARSMLAHAAQQGIPALSVATQQDLSGAAEAVIHPALLTTLVYRLGIPGSATCDVSKIQANGQCFLVRKGALLSVGGFTAVSDSVCEDVTLARALAATGHSVGFYEAGDLVSVEMYGSAGEAWSGWSRSLPMRDRFTAQSSLVGLAEVLLVQALPLPRWLAAHRTGARFNLALQLNAALLMMRLGVLAGTSRAYRNRPATYWLSPVMDMPVALRLIASATRRQHVWRGRTLTTGGRP